MSATFQGHFVRFALAGALLFGGVPAVRAGADLEPQAREAATASEAYPVNTGVARKWADAKAALDSDLSAVRDCAAIEISCGAPIDKLSAIAALTSGHTLRARIALINREINLAIRPQTDRSAHGVDDEWAPPLRTLAEARGDCEDYALLKWAALRAAGTDESDLQLIIVRGAGEDHAMLAARSETGWLILDNRRMQLMDAALVADETAFVLDANGVTRGERIRTAAR